MSHINCKGKVKYTYSVKQNGSLSYFASASEDLSRSTANASSSVVMVRPQSSLMSAELIQYLILLTSMVDNNYMGHIKEGI